MEPAPFDEPAVEIETGPHPAKSIIWLHGLGADGHDFEPIVPELRLPADTTLRFVFPHAPMRPVTINAGLVMRAWYDIVPAAEGLRETGEHVRESEKIVHTLVARERARGVSPRNVVLAGFSQGGAIALHTALRYPERLAGVLVLSGYLPLATALASERHARNDDLPIFMAHGQYDPVIPLVRAQRSRELLEQHGYSVSWHVYAMAHSVTPPELDDLSDWLNEVLRARGEGAR
jgi:phospholipase/carboxylesterase